MTIRSNAKKSVTKRLDVRAQLIPGRRSSVPVGKKMVDEENLIFGARSGNELTHIKDKYGKQVFDVDIECDYYDIPEAKGNKGLCVVLTDAGLNYPVLRSDGNRYRAVGGQIIFTPTYDTTPTRGNTLLKHAQVMIPYSPVEGSLLKDGDLIEFTIAHNRMYMDAGDNTKVLSRSICTGKSTDILVNKNILPLDAAATNQRGFAENRLAIRRKDCTTLKFLGNFTRFDNWNGATATDAPYSETIGCDNFDLFDIYMQVGLKFSVAPTKDAAWVSFFQAIIKTCGE